jgi:glycerophosphoryl diester phosphodiesterase
MDRKINKKIEHYLTTFKNEIKKKLVEEMKQEDEEKVKDLVEYVYNYDRLVLSKEDVSKRKRIQNSIPGLNRCHAKRANGEQCTRKQKEGYTYCGTHVKGTPHGVIELEQKQSELVQGEVFAEEIGGIVFYLDKMNHVYKPEDVLNNKTNPEIIATYVIENGKYQIPEFGI